MLRERWDEVEIEARTGRSDTRPEGPPVYAMMLEGELSSAELGQVGEELFRLMHEGRRNVVVDFVEVSHVDYRGIKPLVARCQLFRRAGGDLKLSGLSPYLRAIFRAAGAQDAFEFYPSVHDAKAAFVRAPPTLC